MKWLAIGDSITAERPWAGITVYTQMLEPILAAAHPADFSGGYSTGYATAASVVNHGHGGWASEYYGTPGYTGFYENAATWQAEALNEDPDVCTIMLGTNDHWGLLDYSDVRVPLANYEANLRGMIADLQADSPVCKIILCTPPPIVSTFEAPVPLASNSRIDTYGDVVRSLAAELGLPLLDVWQQMWDAVGQSEVTLATWLLDDIHPNQTGQNFFRDIFQTKLESVLYAAGTLTLGEYTVPYYDDYTLGNPGPVASTPAGNYRIGTVSSGGAAAVDTAGGRVELETL